MDLKKPCMDCGAPITNKPHVLRCLKCKGMHQKAQTEALYTDHPVPCTQCGASVVLRTKTQRDTHRASGTAYCTAACKQAFLRTVNSRTMAGTNRKYASERMKKRNPMRRAEVRDKVSQTLHRIGHRPPIQGGNGRPMPEAQRALSEALRWPTEVVVKTGLGPTQGYPRSYKIDIANPDVMIGIEVDGFSHQSLERQAQDYKKTELLSGLGWTILRFTNADVTQNLTACVQTVRSTISKSPTAIPSSLTAW